MHTRCCPEQIPELCISERTWVVRLATLSCPPSATTVIRFTL